MSQGQIAVSRNTPETSAKAVRPARYPLTAFPPAFVDELGRYQRFLADPENGTDRVSRPLTIRQRGIELGRAAAILAEHWGESERVRSLAVLVDPANTQVILEAYLKRTRDGEPSAYMHTLTTNLIALARDWVKAPPDELAQLVALRQHTRRKPNELTPGTRLLLQRVADPRARDALLALPATLAARALSPQLSPARRRHEARTALAIELLLHTGMRLHQLATLRIGQDLIWANGKDGPLRILVPDRRATRDGAPQEFELVGPPQTLLQDYLRRFGPKATPQQANPPLFANEGGMPIRAPALSQAITEATEDHIGVRITPKDFRHICAKLILEAFPGDYASVKDLLGHRFLETTLAYYGGAQREGAVTQWNALLAKQRGQRTSQEAADA